MTTYANVSDLPGVAVGTNGAPGILLSAFSPLALDVRPTTNATGQRINNLPVFRAGKFKDSMGEGGEWTIADLNEMVVNFHELKDKGIFPNVPVRENHGRDVREIGGYFADLRVVGDTLYADLDITEPDVFARYERGTYRSRSLELGAYETNDGEFYFPVVMGVAFCDIPAVEGLYSASSSAYSGSGAEISVLESENAGEEPDLTTAAGVVLTALGRNEGGGTFSPEMQQVIEAARALDVPPGDNEMPDTFRFTHNGADVELAGDERTREVLTAYAAESVAKDEEIVALRAANAAATTATRNAAVDGWLLAKKITPAQVEGQKVHAATLNDEQFAAHSALIEAAPELGFTASAAGDENEDEQEREGREALIAQHAATLSGLKMVGFTSAKLQTTAAYKALVALNVTPEV